MNPKTQKINALLMLSGGFDSAVAAYLVKKEFQEKTQKDLEIIALHFSLEPFTNNTPEVKSRELCRILRIKKLIVIKHGDQHSEIVKNCTHKYYYIISRRLMYRVAESIAKKEDCAFILNGENLGQVGSQTLENMEVIDKAVNTREIPIIRPLLCFDKNEIIKIAKKIGTYEISKGPEMCSILGPKHPATKSRLNIIENEEKNIDVERMVNECLAQVSDKN